MASLAESRLEEARAKDNYSIFQPHLKAMVELNKEKARYWGYKEHPYDALLDDFKPGIAVAKCDKLFDAIKPQIIELITKIKESNETCYEEYLQQRLLFRGQAGGVHQENNFRLGLHDRSSTRGGHEMGAPRSGPEIHFRRLLHTVT